MRPWLRPRLISAATIDLCRTVAEARDRQKRGFATANYMNARSNYVGLLGECLAGHLLHLPVNLELLALGDGRTDFPGIDVKTACFYRAPYLKVPPGKIQIDVAYMLIALEPNRRVARYCGYVTGDVLRRAPLLTYGTTAHVLREWDLIRELPQVQKQEQPSLPNLSA